MAAVSSAQQLYITERERQQRSVFIGNIPYEATEEQLREIFAAAGPILTFRLVYDRESGKPKGYGFIEYQDQATAQSAMRNLNNVDFNGRPLRVGPAAGDQNADLRALQQALGGPVPESPFGEPVDSRDAPEAISKAVASLPPEQMFELMKQMKLCIQNNPNEARNMLLQNPQLAYALLQAQIIMKIVDPQVAMALLHRDREQIPPIQPSEPEMRMLPPPPLPPQAALMGPLGMRMLEPPVQPRSLVAAGHPMLGAPMLGAPPALSAAGMPMVAMPGMPPAAIAVAGGGPSMVAGPAALRVPRPVQDPRGGLQQVLPPPPPAQIDPRMMGGVQRGPVPTTGGRLPMPAQPAPGAGASPAAASGTTVTQADQEKAALIMQVLQLSDEQIALLPPDQRTSIMILKQQIARSTGGVA